MARLACIVVFMGACGGSNTTAAQSPLANAETPPLADAATPAEIQTRLPPHPTRQDIARALAEVDADLAHAQDVLANATADRESEGAHEAVVRLSLEKQEILRIERATYHDRCDPLDPLCGE